MADQPSIDLYSEFLSVCQALNNDKIHYVVVGGIAVSLLARPRATEDMDFLIQDGDWDPVCKAILPLGYEPHTTLMTLRTVTIGRAIKFLGPEVLVADFLLLGNDDITMIDNAQIVQIENVQVRLASPETLITLKQRRASPQDLADIEILKGISIT